MSFDPQLLALVLREKARREGVARTQQQQQIQNQQQTAQQQQSRDVQLFNALAQTIQNEDFDTGRAASRINNADLRMVLEESDKAARKQRKRLQSVQGPGAAAATPGAQQDLPAVLQSLRSAQRSAGGGQGSGFVGGGPPDVTGGLPDAPRSFRPATPEQQRVLLDITEKAQTAHLEESVKLRSDQIKAEAERRKGAFKSSMDLRKEYIRLSGSFISQRDAYSRVLASAEDPSAAGDFAMLFNYVKVLDPDSTVREGEFRSAELSQPVLDYLNNLLTRVSTGQRLGGQIRNDFVDRSTKLFRNAQSQQRRVEKDFAGIVKRNRLDPRDVLIDIDIAPENLPTPPVPGAVLVGVDRKTGDFIWDDGR